MEDSLVAVNHQLTTTIGQGVGFERTRRITGYLVGSLDRFNNAKRQEERDRVKHDAGGAKC
jgi:hypothetical protein